MNKCRTLPSLKKIVQKLKKQGKKVVFTNGCFDILHPGHIKILRDAKKKGDVLIVGVNSDASIKRIKGNTRPILDQKSRVGVLEAVEFTDYIILFNEDTPLNLIKEIKPQYLVKGGDWEIDKIAGKDYVEKVFRVKLYPGQSTTGIINKIKNL